MIKIFIIVIGLILFSSPVQASDEWTTEDTALQVLFSGLMLLDWNQSIQELDKDSGYYETNIITGKYPSKDETNLYCATALLGHYYIATKLPRKYRPYWQMFWIGVEYDSVRHNESIGIGVNFKL